MKISKIKIHSQSNNLEEIDWSHIPSKEDVEDMMKRAYNLNSETYRDYGWKNWKEWLENDSAYNISITLESERNIYDLYLIDIPTEEITTLDIIELYKQNKIPSRYQINQAKLEQEKIQIETTDIGERNLPWQNKKVNNLSREEAQKLYEKATTRVTSKNKPEIMQARKEIFIAYNTDPSLPSKLGVSESELNKRIKSQTNFPVSAKKTQEYLNQDIPEEHHWVGMSNSAFINSVDIDENDVDNFVKNINVPESSSRFYTGSSGKMMRRYIMSVFLSVDTRINYKDLNFELGKAISDDGRSVNGTYQPRTNTITISNLEQGTIAHEIGHHIDHKFAKQYISTSNHGIAGNPILTSGNEHLASRIPKEHLQWLDRYNDFTKNLQKKANIDSEYMQDPGEVFARFTDHFVRWTMNQSGHRYYYNDFRYSKDKFTNQDFQYFIRLLQEKSFLDAKFPLDLKT